MKRQVIKKHYNLKFLWNFITVVAILLMPTTSLAGYYVLNLKSPKANVKVFLSVEPDTDTDGPSEAQGLQEQSSKLLSSENREPETIGGLPVSESMHSAQRPPTESASDDTTENQEYGAVGGLPVAQGDAAISSPISVSLMASINETKSNASPLPLVTQPDTTSTPTIRYLETGSATVQTWVERAVASDAARFYQIPSSRLKEFVLTLARLVATETSEIHSFQPIVRYGRYVCNSDLNPSWYIGRIAILTLFLATSASTASGFAMGIPVLGPVSLTTEVCCTPYATYRLSRTQFPNQLQVSFTFNSNSLVVSEETHHLQQIVNILQSSGGFNLVDFSFDPLDGQSARQTLTFNVRAPASMSAPHLQGLLEQSNERFGRPFKIQVSAIGEPICKKPYLETSF